ncbi:pYEATS domain-containing protein [Acetobacter aceti]|uniref:Prokaryotic YEATS domain-containing protein n=1 Tax=Acetobacter aceti TaxID=435 RepID=A0A6S6PPM7_ACEAC|nr:pYEATS domain-containing protein [Acetobacter aceti]BCI68736.1 hypothetical protein AAJCM20276_33600 [Acetobacter aceti]
MPPKKDHGTLSIDACAGVAFRILDAEGREVGRGTSHWSQSRAPGLYAVQWLSATDSHETLVRVNTDATANAAYAPAIAELSEVGIAATLNKAPEIVHKLRPSGSKSDSSIAVVLVTGCDVNEADILRDLKLLNTQEEEIPGSDSHLSGIDSQRRETGRSFTVRPGRYLLTYRAMTGETLQQTVPALRGRQTMIFIEAAKGDVLLAEGKGFARIERAGIDPTRSVMISLGGDETELRIRERLRLTRVLLRDLTTGSGSLTQDFLDILDQPETDPLLKLVALLAVVSHCEADTNPSLDEPWEKGKAPQYQRWLSRADEWLCDLQAIKLPPDAAIARWQLDRLRYGKWLDDGASTISIPPMYSCAWRWASARSAEQPRAIRRYAAIRAATRSRSPTEPWLSWKASAAKAQPSPARSCDAECIEALAQSVAEKSRRLIGDASEPLVAADLIARAGPEAGMVAMHANTISRSVSSQTSLSSDLASALSVPGRTLLRYLASTDQQLTQLLATGLVTSKFGSDPQAAIFEFKDYSDKAYAVRPADIPPAPGIARRIEDEDDPQKGRFGGLASRQSYTARAEFSETNSRSWTRINTFVEGPALDGDEVLFYLHDSFPKNVRRERFRGGRASIAVTTWGGFTVGIWLPRQQIELELDLAQLPNAPKAIRTR